MAEIKPNYDTKRKKLSEIIPLAHPFTVYIEQTKYCNFKCFYCIHSTRDEADGEFRALGHRMQHMDFEFYKKIIKELQKKFNFTIIFVTHDQSEAMALSDRMMVMDMGKIVQIDTPRNLYNKPVNRFVHSFLGKSTFVKVEIKDGKAYPDGDYSQAIPCRLPDDASNGEKRFMAARPNAINLNKSVGYKTKIEKRVFLTDCTEYYVKVGGQMLLVQTPHRVVFRQGEECCVDLVGVMWYKDDDKNSEEERARRQLV